jgi:hypothetical protein
MTIVISAPLDAWYRRSLFHRIDIEVRLKPDTTDDYVTKTSLRTHQIC